MRDPERIPRMLDKLKQLWQLYPDQRLGQLIINYVTGDGPAAFYVEDDKAEARIDAQLPQDQR